MATTQKTATTTTTKRSTTPPTHKRARATKRDIRLPSRYSKDYPDDGTGHDYLLRAVPGPLWKRVMERADKDDLSIRFIAIRLLELYADRGLGPLADGTFGVKRPGRP